jgi:hypothetical protein
MWWNLKNVFMSNVLTMTFTLYLCLHKAVNFWLWTALILFDAGTGLNKATGLSTWHPRQGNTLRAVANTFDAAADPQGYTPDPRAAQKEQSQSAGAAALQSFLRCYWPSVPQACSNHEA